MAPRPGTRGSPEGTQCQSLPGRICGQRGSAWGGGEVMCVCVWGGGGGGGWGWVRDGTEPHACAERWQKVLHPALCRGGGGGAAFELWGAARSSTGATRGCGSSWAAPGCAQHASHMPQRPSAIWQRPRTSTITPTATTASTNTKRRSDQPNESRPTTHTATYTKCRFGTTCSR